MNIFLLDEQHRMIRDMARDFAKKEIAPKAKELDETGRFPAEISKSTKSSPSKERAVY